MPRRAAAVCADLAGAASGAADARRNGWCFGGARSGATPERMLRELTDAFEMMTRRSPLVLCLEDLHWSDVSTLDWIASFARRPEPAGMLVIGTYRPGEAVEPVALT